MLNNEVVPEGATHKWVLSGTDYPWYKKGINGMSFCLYEYGWAETSFENYELDDTDAFLPITVEQADSPSLKDWDDRYPNITNPRSKYHKMIKGVEIDVYDVLHAYGVANQADAHAIKKLLMAGQRGYKDANQDRREAIASIERAIELGSGNE